VALRYRDPVTSKVVTDSAKGVSLELVRDERVYREGFDRSVQEAARLAAAPPSPAVRAEMDHANRYKNSLDTMGDMSSESAKGAQKAIKYRAYETLQ
jgi:hypothetical protein